MSVQDDIQLASYRFGLGYQESGVEILSNRAECFTESNALEKSREIIETYSLVFRRSCV